jgi:hypothetical protein
MLHLTPFHMSFRNVTFLHTDADTIAAAREWLMDCFPNEEEDILEASDRKIVRETHRHYAGGWSQFVAAR